MAGAGQFVQDPLIVAAELMRRRSLLQRVGYLLERGKLLPAASKALQPLEHPVPCLLDPAAPRGGKLNPRWQVFENAAVSLR